MDQPEGSVKITARMREFLLWIREGEPHKTFRQADLQIFHRARRLGLIESTTFKEDETDTLPTSTFRLSATGSEALGEEKPE